MILSVSGSERKKHITEQIVSKGERRCLLRIRYYIGVYYKTEPPLSFMDRSYEVGCLE
jgi:hypothetical protein